MSDEAIETRLLAVDVREIGEQLDAGQAVEALHESKKLLARFPNNAVLQDLHVVALSANQRDEEAREFVRGKLASSSLDDAQKVAWLNRQARVELYAAEPSSLVLDLAVQKVLSISAGNLVALATKGAALTLRGQYQAGGDMLASVWRRNNGQVRDAELLAYLAIAAFRTGNTEAHDRFRSAFEQVNRSSRLRELVATNAG